MNAWERSAHQVRGRSHNRQELALPFVLTNVSKIATLSPRITENSGLTTRPLERAHPASPLIFLPAFHVASWAFPGAHLLFRAQWPLRPRPLHAVLALTRLRFVITEVMYNSFAYIQLPLVGPPVKSLLSPPHSLSSPAPLHATPEASAQQSHVIACHRITQQPHHQQCRV